MDIMMKQFHENKLKARLAFTVPKMIEIRMHAQVSPPFLFLWSCDASIIEYKTHKILNGKEPAHSSLSSTCSKRQG